MNTTFNAWYEKKMLATPELAEETKWIASVLPTVRTIAIVGLSSNPHKDSHYVGRYLQKAGYKIIPVNPGVAEILGEKSYKDLSSLPEKPDIVNVFIRPDFVPAVVAQALETQTPLIWLQLGTGEHPDLEKEVAERGSRLIQKRCIKVDHQFLIRDAR